MWCPAPPRHWCWPQASTPILCAVATRVTASTQEANAFQAGVNKVSWLLIRFAFVMVPLVLLINGFTKGNWSEAFLFALSVAVGLTPEMLPMIVTSTLAKGAVLLSRKKVIVKRLDAIQNFGAMNVLCTDKTGLKNLLDRAMLERVLGITRDLNEDGLRVVAVAMKEIPPSQVVYSVADESELTLMGYIAFLDPPKESTAPALKALAESGITVKVLTGDNELVTSQVCRQVGLMVLEQGVIEGRKTFNNMLKYIRMTASSNFGNVFSVLIASVFLPFLPMLPLQLLVQNLLYDVSQIAIPFDKVDAELVKKPLSWNPDDIRRFMIFFGPISSIFDVTAFVVMWYVFKANSVENQALFQSGWFVVGLLTQTLIVHMIRTPRTPFIQSRAAWPLMAMTLFIMAAGIFLPMGPLASYFKLQALPLPYFAWLTAILLSYVVLTTRMKRYYIRRFGWQ
ncbi:cation transporting ATPase C-terminal domain-containing protein [Polaromonas sp.]|uniref:cation transporting ATPase C-terminal domain-containing protein n=1 Tax=Polaromonas sp. TaxID=1869339 RepID=UPI003521CAEC